MKKLLENKSYGFYVTFVSVVASIVCAAVYASMYSGSRYMEWPAVVAMLVGAAVSLVLMFTKKAGWANAVIAAADFVAFLYYVYRHFSVRFDIPSITKPCSFHNGNRTVGRIYIIISNRQTHGRGLNSRISSRNNPSLSCTVSEPLCFSVIRCILRIPKPW